MAVHLKRWAGACVVSGLLVMRAAPLPAQVVWDNGAADGSWFTAAAWSGGALPTGADVVQINNAAAVTINQSGAVAERVILGANSADASGVLSITGGSLTTPRLYAGATGVGVINQSGGTVEVSTQLWHSGFAGTTGHATYNLNGGSVTFASSAANTRIARNGATGIVNHSGGTWTSNGLFVSTQPAAGGVASPGTYSISGHAVMTLLGRLYIDHANIGSPDTTAVARGLDGAFSITGSNASISNYGYLQGEGGRLTYVADAGGISTINVSDADGDARFGDVRLNGTLSIDLSAMASQPQAIILISNTSPKTVLGAFSNAAEGTTFGNYQLTYAYVNHGDEVANDVALVLIPEPSAAMLAGLACAALATSRRRSLLLLRR
jgi:hypothetical protein